MNKKENKIFQEMEALRKEKYIKPKKMMMIYAPFIGITFIILMPIVLLISLLIIGENEGGITKKVEELTEPGFLIFFGVSILIFLIFLIFRYAYIKKSRLSDETRKKLSTQLNEIFINSKNDNLKFEKVKKDIDTQENLTPFAFYSKTRTLNKNIILGNYKNINFSISNIEFHRAKRKIDPSAAFELWEIFFYLFIVSIKNGIVKLFDMIKKGKIKGRLYVYKFNEKIDDEIRIVEKFGIKGFSLKKGGFKKIETEMLGFNKKFKIYSNNEKLYYKLVNARIIEKMYKLKKLHKGKVYCCYKANELYFFINNKSDFSYVNLDKPIIDDQINDYFKEDMKLIHEIIDDFELTNLKSKI